MLPQFVDQNSVSTLSMLLCKVEKKWNQPKVFALAKKNILL